MSQPSDSDSISTFSSETGVLARLGRAWARFRVWGTGKELIHIDDEFRRARRNLVVASGAGLLLGFARFDSDLAGAPLFTGGAQIPVAALVGATMLYIFYLTFGFNHEAHRATVRASTLKMETQEGKSGEAIRDHLNKLLNGIEGALHQAEASLASAPNWNKSRHRLQETLETESGNLKIEADELAKASAGVMDEWQREVANTDPSGPYPPVRVTTSEANLEGLAASVSASLSARAGLLKNLVDRIPTGLTEFDIKNLEAANDQRLANLQKHRTSFEQQTQDLLALSDTLDGRDRRHTILYVLGLPYALAFVGFIAAPIGQHKSLQLLFDGSVAVEQSFDYADMTTK